jgi:hypothetical protein
MRPRSVVGYSILALLVIGGLLADVFLARRGAPPQPPEPAVVTRPAAAEPATEPAPVAEAAPAPRSAAPVKEKPPKAKPAPSAPAVPAATPAPAAAPRPAPIATRPAAPQVAEAPPSKPPAAPAAAPVVAPAPAPAPQAAPKEAPPAAASAPPPAAPAPAPLPAPPAAAPEPAPATPVEPAPAAAAVAAAVPQAAPSPATPAAPAEAPSASPASDDALPIVISSPREGGYYNDITILEGRVGSTEPVTVTSFTWEIVGRPGMTGRVVISSEGAFKVPVPLSDISGDAVVRLTAVRPDGRASHVDLSLHDGTKKPAIDIRAPSQGGAYGSLIRVAGTVTDPYAGKPGMEGVASMTYLLAPVEYSRTSTPARGTVSLGRGNSFRFSLPTTGLSGPQDLTLSVVAKSGNRAETTLRLTPGNGDLGGFVVTPADRRVTVSWTPVAFAAGFDLSYAAGGEAPEKGTTMRGVSSPVTVSGLENGTLYSLRVKVRYDDGASGLSSLVRLIPLSPRTLSPTVKGDYQQIHLAWNRIRGAESFDVWRSPLSDGGWIKIAASVPTAVYVDSAVEFGKDYFYAISPAAGPLAPLSAPGSGKSLAFPADKLAVVGYTPVAGARRIAIVGGYAFAACGARGVRVVDVSAPRAPVAVGAIAMADARCVVVRGEYAYVADGESGLRVLDVSSPRAPLLIGTRRTSDASAVAVAGSYAYVADGLRGLKVIDISDPRSLPRVAAIESTNARDLAVSTRRLFVADGAGGLRIFDITRGAAPAAVARIPTTDARSVALMGTLVLVADGAGGLRIVETAGETPVLLGTFPMAMALAVTAADGFAYVVDGKSGVTVVNCEDPAHPALFTMHPTAGAAAVSVAERQAYVADAAGITLLRIQIQGRSFSVASCATGGRAYDVAVDGAWAYVAAHSEGLHVVNVSDPARLTDKALAGSLSTRFAQRVTVRDHLAYVADGSSGVRIIDVSPAWSTPAGPPVEVAAYRTGGTASRVALSGQTAYVAAGSQGVQVLDISTPSAPTTISSVRSADASDIVLSDSWAFLADGDEGVKVIDISTREKPLLLPVSLAGNTRALALSGNLLAAAGAGGVRFIDVANPRAPVVRGTYETSDAEGLAMRGSYVFVAEGYRGLTVIDVTRPSRPVVVSGCSDVFAVGVAVKGEYAIVADSLGLKVVRILIPEWLTH